MFVRGFGVLIALCMVLLLPLGGTAAQEAEPQEKPRYTRQMLVIVIDGLQADALQKAQAPNINGVAASGIRINDCIPVWPGGLEASAASILTGTGAQTHQFLQAGDKLKQPTLFDLIRPSNLAGGFFDASGRLDGLAANADYHLKIKGDDKLVEAAVKEMEGKKPYLSVLVLADARKALEESGRSSQEYYRAVSNADNLVGRLLHFLHQQGVYEQTLIVITGTDGEPPLIVKGVQFKGGVVLPPADLLDIAPTLAYILNLKIPAPDGLVLWNAFEPGSLQNGFYLLEQRIRELSRAQAESQRAIHRLWDEGEKVREEKQELEAKEAGIAQAIQERDREIERLEKSVDAHRHLIGLLVVLFGFGYVVEYRVLKKRFLLF
ncbi:MAG: alkaline phosphatase family protein [Bacillota bacterium]